MQAAAGYNMNPMMQNAAPPPGLAGPMKQDGYPSMIPGNMPYGMMPSFTMPQQPPFASPPRQTMPHSNEPMKAYYH